jgi:hypothetical protein
LIDLSSELFDEALQHSDLTLEGCKMDGSGTIFHRSVHVSPKLFDQTPQDSDIPQPSGHAQRTSEVTADP